MKTVPTDLQAALDSGVTTLCTCWRIERADNAVFGFTNHDRSLSFGGDTYEPESGFTGSEIAASLGLNVNGAEVQGALSSARITDDDIALGLWDNAAVEIWRVDWSDASRRMILRRGSLGEISRGDVAYEAEVRGLAHHLNQEQGRAYGRLCDVKRLGDARCGVNVASSTFTGTGAVVSALDNRIITVTGLGGYSDGWFTHGHLTWTSGPNAGAEIEVRHHTLEAGNVRIALWRKAVLPIGFGNAFTVVAGCDRRWETCKAKFSNGANFRGFPHVPGNDATLGVAKRSNVNDGGSFFR